MTATNVPVTFLGRARKDIGSPRVAALDTGARRLTAMRLNASAQFPGMEAMRDHARQIRLHTLARLDHYLGEFADRVEELGGHVHWAADGDEANEIVRKLATDRNVKRIVKSKSMVTEETELNQALEAADLEVVETDLGEFIVQLAGDRPSHIIAPVLHKTRFEIGELFRDSLGADYTDDPTELNAIARRYLRHIFLTAGMGISGVNFAVAETGSISLVTNEGNGRLTTTAPRIHVAFMGMERIVPTFGDLAVMLEVLARSGTGQRLSVYTNIVTGPRRPGDPDGPEEFHVVILDNGRSAVLDGDLSEILACIRCGACLNICPVYRHTGGHAYGSTYSGPVGAVVTPSLMGLDAWHDLPDASSLCGACKEACPIRIDIPGLLLELRSRSADAGHSPAALRRGLQTYAAAATRPAVFRALLRSGGVAGRALPEWMRKLPLGGAAWTDHRHFPRPAATPFHQWWKERNRGA
jgi:L-lactate dehydrogenase complex protein LldF